MKYCIVCGSKKNSEKIGVNIKFGWDVLYCNKCKLAYGDEEDSKIKKRYTKYYTEEYWHSKEGKKNILGTDPEQQKMSKAEAILSTKIIPAGIKFIRALGVKPLIAVSHHHMIKKYVRDDKKIKFLEIGPGEGYSLRYFNKLYDISAIEPDKPNTKNINKYFGRKVCVSGDAETDKIAGKYDIVYMCHVFEHIVSPLKFLHNIKNNIKDDGILFIEVPNCEWPRMMQISALENETHTYHYKLEGINKLLKKAGYKILESGVYSATTNNPITTTFRSIFNIYSYKKMPLKQGIKIVVIAKKDK
ncbi:MAG TPA: class I SAM-dependent methyltransferase [Alphaproteobacteria bacterium]|nr:class I SAM-dependent methyltransferase [Alphaproteobacteria bacterium]